MASRWDGRILGHDNISEGSTFAFSPNGRYVAALEGYTAKHPPILWVLDLKSGKMIKRRKLPKNAGEALGWIDASTVGMALLANDKNLIPLLRLHGKQPTARIPVYGQG